LPGALDGCSATGGESCAGAAGGSAENDHAAPNPLSEWAADRDCERRGEGRVHHRLLVTTACARDRGAPGFEGPNINRVVYQTREAALIGGRGVRVVPGINCRAAGEQGHRLSRPTVILQTTEQGVGIDLIAGAGQEATAAVAAKIVTIRAKVT